MIVRNDDGKMSIADIIEQEDPNLARKVARISDNIDPVLLAYEGLEVINNTGFNVKVRLVLVKATNRFFFYIDDLVLPCNCHAISYKDQQEQYKEGFRIIPNGDKGAPLDKVPITESEY